MTKHAKRRYFQRGLERLTCFFLGHRALAPAEAYGEEIPGRDDQELHYCAACGAPVWVRKPHRPQPTVRWLDCGLAR
ncbi:MAG TPA: hypothetical protein VMV10_27745 [Pirellulales bacterium]|nr:hypothetical protein [Pirellulales bacterium]